MDLLRRCQIETPVDIVGDGRIALMCSEAIWWRCHRSMIADYPTTMGAQVLHILSPTRVQEHPYTSAARRVDGRLSYESAFPTALRIYQRPNR